MNRLVAPFMSSGILLNTIRNVVSIDRATSVYSNGLRVGLTVHLSDLHADRMLKLMGFSAPESGGRWTDGATATIGLKLAPELVGIGRLRLHMMPFVTEKKGQTLRLRCGKGEERVVHFSPGAAFVWETVDLPLADVRADGHAQIHLAVDHTFVPSKLGLSSDSRALGVMIRQIELLADAVSDRVDEPLADQMEKLTTPSSLAAEDLVPLAVGSSISLASPDAGRMIRLTGFSELEPDGRWTDGGAATIGLKLAPELVGIGRLRLHMMPFVTEKKGQTLRLRCGKGEERVVHFSPGAAFVWETVDLPLADVRLDGHAQIHLAVDHTFVPSKLGLSSDSRALGVMIRQIELLADAVSDRVDEPLADQMEKLTTPSSLAAEDLVPLAVGSSISLASPDAGRMIRLTGFSELEPDGRWTDGGAATIGLKLAPELVGIGRLRLHMMPFVTEKKGQTLRLRCGKGEERVVHFSPGAAFVWETVDLPLADVRADGHAQIHLAVDHTFVPSKLGLSSDSRALGVMIRQIELLADAVSDRVDEPLADQMEKLTTPSSLAAEDLVPLAVGSSISLASPDAGRMIRLTGFSELEPDGRWTDGEVATVALRLANPTGNGRLRLHFTPFVTSHTEQSIRVNFGDGPELTRRYSAGLRRQTLLDLPLNRVEPNGEISISIKIDAPNSPASVGLGGDERRLGIQLHRLSSSLAFPASPALGGGL